MRYYWSNNDNNNSNNYNRNHDTNISFSLHAWFTLMFKLEEKKRHGNY